MSRLCRSWPARHRTTQYWYPLALHPTPMYCHTNRKCTAAAHREPCKQSTPSYKHSAAPVFGAKVPSWAQHTQHTCLPVFHRPTNSSADTSASAAMHTNAQIHAADHTKTGSKMSHSQACQHPIAWCPRPMSPAHWKLSLHAALTCCMPLQQSAAAGWLSRHSSLLVAPFDHAQTTCASKKTFFWQCCWQRCGSTAGSALRGCSSAPSDIHLHVAGIIHAALEGGQRLLVADLSSSQPGAAWHVVKGGPSECHGVQGPVHVRLCVGNTAHALVLGGGMLAGTMLMAEWLLMPGKLAYPGGSFHPRWPGTHKMRTQGDAHLAAAVLYRIQLHG